MEENETYKNPWQYQGRDFVGSDIGDNYGFVYLITCDQTGRRYIGRKYFYQKRKPRAGNKNVRRRRVTSESNWRNYYGSCPELSEDVKRYGHSAFVREILSLHKTVGKTNYEETKQLFINNVLTESKEDGIPAWYNSNVLGRYYRKDYFETVEEVNTST